MQQTVELTELGHEVWSEEEAVDQKTKMARRSKVEFDSSVHQKSPWKSKRYGYRFDLVMIKASGEELDIVKCNMCSRTFNKCGTGGLKAHAAFHVSNVVDPRKRFEDSLLKFVICSAQPFYLVNNKSFIGFLDSFQTLVIENTKNNVLKQSKELLPSSNTVSSRIDKACENVQSEVSMKISNLVLFGGGLTLDFAKNRVDYLAVTGHYIGKNWQKTNLVLMFEPVPGMQKTAVNVRLLVESKLAELGLNQWAKVFVTTDEGSNVNAIGGVNHQACLCHIGATIAKRCCILYKDSSLSSGVKENCAEVNRCLNEIEKLVIKIRQVEEVRSAASEALRLPVQTRWLSYYDMLVSIRNKNICWSLSKAEIRWCQISFRLSHQTVSKLT